jgi:trk system potassium uptake protein TrkH
MNAILTIIHIFGLVTMGFSGLMGTCLITSKIADDGATSAFFEGTWITFLLGVVMFFPTLRFPGKRVFYW